MMKKILLLLLLLAAIPCTQAQNTYKDVDSTLYRYYRWCNNHIRNSAVLLKADTLFRLSARKQDVRMQAAALSLKADHYYFTAIRTRSRRGSRACRHSPAAVTS